MHHVVCLFMPQLSLTHCAYPRRDGQAELTWLLMLIVCVMYCRLASRAVEIDQLRAEKSTVEQSLVEQQRKVADDEGRVANAVAKLKDSFQLAENAVVERDQVGFCASFFDFLLLIFVVNTSKSYCLGDLSPKCVEWDIKPYSLTNQTSN